MRQRVDSFSHFSSVYKRTCARVRKHLREAINYQKVLLGRFPNGNKEMIESIAYRKWKGVTELCCGYELRNKLDR